ncbi:MAG: TonB-dependent receptor [Oceanococcus sp.]
MLMSNGFRPIFVRALILGVFASMVPSGLMAQDAEAQDELDFDALFGEDAAAPSAQTSTAAQPAATNNNESAPEQLKVVELPEEPVPVQRAVLTKRPAHLEEIIVTARKRAESIQEIPLSVTPFNADVLEQRGMNGLDDIAASTPGFTFEAFQSGGAHGNAVIRGLAQQFTTSRVQNVSFFIDGVYLQRQSMLDLGMIDMQRVEVVKGPQNALFGRNAFAGAVNYITLRPGAEPEGYLMATMGDNSREQYRFSMSGPLDDSQTLFGKFSAGVSRYDGHTKNNHPVANADPIGDNVQGMLGGHNDATYSLSLAYEPIEKLRTRVGYYRSELTHETGAGYGISGVNAARFGLRLESENDLNCNTATVSDIGVPSPTHERTGYTLWCGELPNYASDVAPRTVDGIVVDPRAIGFRGVTSVVTLSTEYDLSEAMTVHYMYGQADHESYTDGGTSDEDPLKGRGIMTDLVRYTLDYNDEGAYTFANTASGRPNSELESFSHELRLDWEFASDLLISTGLYYSVVEDQEWTSLFINDLCNADSEENIRHCNEPLSHPNSIAEQTTLTVGPAWDQYTRQHGGVNRGEWTGYKDSITAAFASVSYQITPTIEATLEGRFTMEDKEVVRFTDFNMLADGESVTYGPPNEPVEPLFAPTLTGALLPFDDESYNYFTPRGIINWQWADSSMLYVSAAKGVKSGGFNNSSVETEQTYDEAENWTYEIGSKNSFFGRMVTLNGAVYLIEWTGMQGGVPPQTGGLSSSDVITNLGGASSLGIELESSVFLPYGFSMDLGFTYNDATYDEGVIYSGGASTGSFHCDGVTCPLDGGVGGNQLARTSKVQGSLGLNYNTHLFDWDFNGRIDASYQSKQFLSPLNVGWVPDRTLTNASFNFGSPNGQWEFISWIKNLTDEDYPANAFVLGVFNQYLVGKGPGRTWGSTLKYKF